ncbi:hypothetical protein HCDG_08474 [Histoplasma capsulatum H143]|uniref:Uncharacterized protein n=1 Tax=Ajellomyces capsulatus (strain H143) TaxID=544712 RepID=C6HR89_AJECH|nr:hypothetical protein HCDG_08474 [Histoplasma capsulatum H143]
MDMGLRAGGLGIHVHIHCSCDKNSCAPAFASAYTPNYLLTFPRLALLVFLVPSPVSASPNSVCHINVLVLVVDAVVFLSILGFPSPALHRQAYPAHQSYSVHLVSILASLLSPPSPPFSQRSTRRLVLDLTSESKLQYSPFHSHPPSPAQLAPLGSFDLAASTWSDLAVPATLICPRNYPVPVTSLGHRLRSDLRRGKTLADIPIPIPRPSQARPSPFVPGPIMC